MLKKSGTLERKLSLSGALGASDNDNPSLAYLLILPAMQGTLMGQSLQDARRNIRVGAPVYKKGVCQLIVKFQMEVRYNGRIKCASLLLNINCDSHNVHNLRSYLWDAEHTWSQVSLFFGSYVRSFLRKSIPRSESMSLGNFERRLPTGKSINFIFCGPGSLL